MNEIFKQQNLWLFIFLFSFYSCSAKPHKDILEISPKKLGPANYIVSAYHANNDHINTFPQTITEVISNNLPYRLVKLKIISTLDRYFKAKTVPVNNYNYDKSINIFLEPSAKIESNSPKFKKIIETIKKKYQVDENEDEYILDYVVAFLDWAHKYITFDKSIANDIWSGKSNTISALNVLDLKKGTCSEYANLFIALARAANIPARFVEGKVFRGVYHSWVEVYIHSIGWLPVDPSVGPTKGVLGITPRHIKLFIGKDFVDINVKLKDIKARITPDE